MEDRFRSELTVAGGARAFTSVIDAIHSDKTAVDSSGENLGMRAWEYEAMDGRSTEGPNGGGAAHGRVV